MDKVQEFKNMDLPKSYEEFERRTKIPKIRNEFIAQLEHSLMFLSYTDTPVSVSEAQSAFNLKTFDGCWIIGQSLRHSEGEGFVFAPFGDLQVSPDMFPNLNIRTLNLNDGMALLQKHRFLDAKEKRNLNNYRFIDQYRYAYLDAEKRKWFSSEFGYGFQTFKKQDKESLNFFPAVPVSLRPGYVYDDFDAIQHTKTTAYLEYLKVFHTSLNLALTQYYEWTCYIKETPNSIGVRIPIHPSSSKEVFMMRNIPEGSQRKRAIVNFVKDHYRTVKGLGNEREVLIQKHFRGDLKFRWRGLEVHVTPSQYDLNRIKTTKKFETT